RQRTLLCPRAPGWPPMFARLASLALRSCCAPPALATALPVAPPRALQTRCPARGYLRRRVADRLSSEASRPFPAASSAAAAFLQALETRRRAGDWPVGRGAPGSSEPRQEHRRGAAPA